MTASFLRQMAQKIRHMNGLRHLSWIWFLLRKPYMKILDWWASDTGLSVTVAGFPMKLHPRFAAQNWETLEVEGYKTFVQKVKPGFVVYDVGAHIGTYTILARRQAGPKGCVIAYEPHAVTSRYLAQHLKWNPGNAGVIVRQVALGSTKGVKPYYFRAGDDQTEGMNGFIPVEGFERKDIAAVTLDDEVAYLKFVPNLIKIDVEGGEWDVLQGAQHTISKYHPTLLLSIHPTALAHIKIEPEMILSWLRKHHYKCKTLSKDHEIHILAEKKT